MKKILKRNRVLVVVTLLTVMASCSPVHRYGCNRRCRIPLSLNEVIKPLQQKAMHA